MRHPELESISPQVVDWRPGTRITLKGSYLAAGISVLVGGRVAAISSASPGRIEVKLPSGLSAGAVTVAFSEPDAEQASGVFYIRPVLLAQPVFDEPSSQVVVEVAPDVQRGQRPALLLNRYGSGEPASWTLDGEPGASGSCLRFAAADVGSGTYLLRVRVGGVSSALEVDEDPQSPTYRHYSGPRVSIP